MSIENVEELRSLHSRRCGCLLPTEGDRIDKPGTRCPVTVEGLVLAIDCDDCTAFGADKKPDIVALQRCDKRLTWILVEVKENLDRSARHQIESALAKIRTGQLFQARIERARAYVAFRKSAGHMEDRRALGRMNLRFGGEDVPIRTARCPVRINCPKAKSTTARRSRSS